MGRDKYETHVLPHLKEIEEWFGTLNESQIAERLHISRNSLAKYKKTHPELNKIFERGATKLIQDLKLSLKQRALGYYYEESKKTLITDADGNPTGEIKVEIFRRHSPGDIGAAHLLLKNLDPTWRNDDQTTIDLKKEKMQLEKEKADNNSWT